MRDYLTMLNERDGGIGGVKLNVEECETGYDTKKGVECTRPSRARVRPGGLCEPLFDGHHIAIDPESRGRQDPGLVDGLRAICLCRWRRVPLELQPPATYWMACPMIFRYIGGKEGGLDKLKGKTIGFIFLESGYGREPIPLLNESARTMASPSSFSRWPARKQDQSAQWLAVRRDRPAWMIMWGWGDMNPTAVKRAAESNYPMDRFIGIWWSGTEDDARPAGPGGKGYLSLNLHAVGPTSRLSRTSSRPWSRRVRARPDKGKLGENLYNRGVYNSVLVAEAIRSAQRVTGKKSSKARTCVAGSRH